MRIQILDSDCRLPLREDPWARKLQFPSDWQRPLDCDCPTELAENPRHQIAKITQLARATFPWVNYHRQTLIRDLKPVTPLSHLADHYFDQTAGVSKEWFDRFQRQGKFSLYTLDGYQGPDKALESWTQANGDSTADQAFGLTVVTGVETRQPIGSPLFAGRRQAFTFRYATANCWNRVSPQHPSQRIDLYCKRIVPSIQAATGWDTLNWSHDCDVHELVGFGIPQTFPKIQPSWTSSLSPTSAARLEQIRQQPLPAWALEVRDLIPSTIDESLLGL